MIEVPKELIEAMPRRQMVVAIAEMVLAELPGRVSLRLHDIGNGRHPVGDAMGIAWHADGQQASAERFLAEDEGGTPGGAALLAISVREDRALPGDTVDVGRAVTHHPHRVGTDLGYADIVAKDNENIGPLAGRGRRRRPLRLRLGHERSAGKRRCRERSRREEDVSAIKGLVAGGAIHNMISHGPVLLRCSG